MLEPDRPLKSWRETLKIEQGDWSNDIETFFPEPEPWELGMSEVWFGLEKMGRFTYSISAVGILCGRGLQCFFQRMGFALAKAEPELMREGLAMPLIGSSYVDFQNNLREPCLYFNNGRLRAYVSASRGSWSKGCDVPGFCRV